MLMDELKIDFAMKRGNELIVDLQSGITRERLDQLEIQMLQSQRIPMLLPVQWIDMDGQITFRYLFTGKRIMLHRLQTQQLSMQEFYTVLLAIVETLDDCRHYMLRADNFLLHEQYIFIGDSWENISLVYVPLRGERMVTSAGEAVLAMAVRFVSVIDQPDGAGLQRVFQYLRDEYVSWTSLRQTLLSLLGDGYRAERTGELEAIEFEPVRVQEHQTVKEEERLEPLRFGTVNHARTSRAHLPEEFEHELPMADQLPESERAEASVTRTKWIIGAIFVLVNGLIWRYLYMASPSRTSLLMSSGLSVLAIAILLVFRQKKSSHATEHESGWAQPGEWGEEDSFTPDSRLLGKLTSKSSLVQKQNTPVHQHLANMESVVRGGEAPLLSQKLAITKQPDELEINAKHQPIYQQPASRDATVLLGGGQGTQSTQITKGGAVTANDSSSWLERQLGEGAERIRLAQLHFIIGRLAEGVQYADSSHGISRAHLEFINSKGSWSAKDMGSRNGSTLNGNTMIPYKAYELSDNDLIQLAGEKGPKYVFRAG
ncbi:DUF6382 domain-containing protein [Paenibacillus sp. OV219]|uniref:DUF6382 domain-containing protein n=1 Tax=Paenibacillus sp. OV219 TaxID=1884377 RepID=UPI0008B2E3B2|nr:DUF6382 domain-containing protein [Paenibacillus sp. OV219]SEN85669.1 FHA domain-containing protein [Paenibacillus sp. OV219]